MGKIKFYGKKSNTPVGDNVGLADIYHATMGVKSLKKIATKVIPFEENENLDDLVDKSKALASLRESTSFKDSDETANRETDAESTLELARASFQELMFVYHLKPSEYGSAQALEIVQNWREGGMAKWVWAYQLTETTSSLAVQAKGVTFGAGFIRKFLWRVIKGQMLAGKTGDALVAAGEKRLAKDAAKAAKLANPSRAARVFSKIGRVCGRAFNWVAGVSFIIDLANETVFHPALSDVYKYVEALIRSASVLRKDQAFKALLDDMQEVCPKKYAALITESPLGVRALQESEELNHAIFQALGTVKTMN